MSFAKKKPDNLKIVYISQGNIPSKWAHTFQAMKMVEGLSKNIKDITLLTSKGIFQKKPLKKQQIDISEWYGLKARLKIRRIPSTLIQRDPLIEGCRYRIFDLFAAIYARLRSPDVVYTRSPLAAFFCVALKLDTILEAHFEPAHSQFKWLLRANRKKNFIGLVTVTAHLKKLYSDRGIDASRIFVASDAVEHKMFMNLEDKTALRSKLGFPGHKTIAVYCGHFYQYKGVQYIIQAAAGLPDVEVYLVGGWDSDIERLKHEYSPPDNIIFTGFQPNNIIPAYLAASDFLILPNSGLFPEAKTTSPLKLFEYMASGTPVIASDIEAFKGILENRVNSVLVEPDSPEAINEAIRTLKGDSLLADKIAQQAKEDVKNLTWENRSLNILNYFYN